MSTESLRATCAAALAAHPRVSPMTPQERKEYALIERRCKDAIQAHHLAAISGPEPSTQSLEHRYVMYNKWIGKAVNRILIADGRTTTGEKINKDFVNHPVSDIINAVRTFVADTMEQMHGYKHVKAAVHDALERM